MRKAILLMMLFFFFFRTFCFAQGLDSLRVLYAPYNSDSVKVSPFVKKKNIHKLIKESKKYLGTKHAMGGLNNNGIDCSGLVCKTFKSLDIELPHRAHDLAFYGEMILDMDSLQKGDLLFFSGTYKSKHFITHVGIYLGDDEFIHASSSKGVIITNLLVSSYWNPKFVFAKRYFY